MRATVPLVLSMLLIGACGDVTTPVVMDDPEGTPEPVEEVIDQRCEEVPDDLVTEIAGELDDGVELSHAMGVDSGDVEQTTFVSAELTGTEVESTNPIATWAVVENTIFSVNAVARELSDWPDGTVEQGLSMNDDGGEESKECVEAAAG